nr:hypothetical protein [Tanacetum cinerariifolium]
MVENAYTVKKLFKFKKKEEKKRVKSANAPKFKHKDQFCLPPKVVVPGTSYEIRSVLCDHVRLGLRIRLALVFRVLVYDCKEKGRKPSDQPRPAVKPQPAKKTKSGATASTGGSSASTQFGALMEQELRLKREAAERAFEAQAEKDRTLMLLEELRFLATSTKDLDDDDAY